MNAGNKFNPQEIFLNKYKSKKCEDSQIFHKKMLQFTSQNINFLNDVIKIIINLTIL